MTAWDLANRGHLNAIAHGNPVPSCNILLQKVKRLSCSEEYSRG